MIFEAISLESWMDLCGQKQLFGASLPFFELQIVRAVPSLPHPADAVALGSFYIMPRQVTRAMDRLKQPVRKAVLSGGLDRDILEDDSLITGLSELQTKQVGLLLLRCSLCLKPRQTGHRQCSGIMGLCWRVGFSPQVEKMLTLLLLCAHAWLFFLPAEALQRQHRGERATGGRWLADCYVLALRHAGSSYPTFRA